ncbi:MAG: hypothetical protein JSR58_04160 [Verrucomicrobia bacterium]|nr:hypothetical protein [Verrucomicrobiota bacterium]
MKSKKAKWPWVILTLLGLVVGAWVSRYYIVAQTLQWALSYYSQEKFVYNQRQIHGKGIEYQDVMLGDSISARHVAIDWNWKLFPLFIEQNVRVDGATFKIDPESNNTALVSVLFPTKYFGVRLHVSEGDIFIHDRKDPFNFSFQSGDRPDDMGTLKIGQTITARAQKAGEGMQIQASMKDVDVCDARDLLIRFLKMPVVEKAVVAGKLQFDGSLELDREFALRSVQADLKIENALWEKENIGLTARLIQFSLHYPSGEHGALWRQVLAALSWEDGHLIVQNNTGPWTLHMHKGLTYLSPHEEPRFELEGVVGEKMKVSVTARGVLEEGQVPWAQMQVNAGESLAHLSINCSDWDLFRIKVELENWKEEALQESIKIAAHFFPELQDVRAVSGSVKGRIEGRIEKGALHSVEWHDLSMQGLYFEMPKENFQGYFGNMISLGSAKGKNIHQCDVQMSQATFRYDKWRAENVQGHLKMIDCLLQPSLFSCQIEGIQSDLRVEGRWDALELKAAMEAPVGVWAQLVHTHEPLPVDKTLHLDLSGVLHDGRLDTTGVFKTDVDHGEFGLSLSKGMIDHGWFAISRATSGFCTPFLPSVQGLSWEGQLAIRGKIQGSSIEGHFIVDNPSLHNHVVQTKAHKLDEGHFKYNLQSKKLEGEFFLQEGEIEQVGGRSIGIKGLEGGFFFTENQIDGKNLSCNWDGLTFLGELQLLFAEEEGWDLRLTSRMAEGDLAKIIPLLSLDSNISGKFYTEKEGIQCRIHNNHEGTNYFVRAKANLRHLQAGPLKEGEGLLEYDSSASLAILSQFHGKVGQWDVKSHKAKIQILPSIPLEFDVEISKKQQPLFQLQGVGYMSEDGQYQLELSSDLSRKLNVSFKGPDILWDLKWSSTKAQGSISPQGYFLSSLSTEDLPGVVFSTSSPVLFKDTESAPFSILAKEGEKVIGELSAKSAHLRSDGLEIPGAQLYWKEWKLPLDIYLSTSQAKLKTGSDVLKISWENGIRFQGALHGLSLDMKQAGNGYVGGMKIKDGNTFAVFTQKEIFKHLQGVVLKGTWTPSWSFTGIVQGEELALKGFLLHELQGDMTINPKGISITNLQIDDPAGHFSIKQIYVRKSITGSWDTDIPLVKAHHFKPSLLRQTDGKLTKEKPFEIRSLVLTDLFCEDGDMARLRGKGAFHFTNHVKRESSLFDIPLKMMKDLGLDFDLFRPESGDVKCLFREGRIYLTELENSYSEGRRSEFFLAPDLEPSYIDWQGNLHLNLRMKQDVALKLGEPFAITVRGTADKPSYGLR